MEIRVQRPQSMGMVPEVVPHPALTLTTLALLLISLTACKRELEIDRACRERILLVGNSAEPKGLDTQLVTGVLENKVLSSLFEGLVGDAPADDAALPPGAATHWEANARMDQWTFHLRPNVLWSDGKAPVTAADFTFSYHRILHPLLAAPYAEMLYFLKNAETYNKDRRGEILFRLNPHPDLPWDQLKEVNFTGDPTADLSALGKNPDFAALDEKNRTLWVRHHGLDRMDKAQLAWIAASPEARFTWPDTLPPARRFAVLQHLTAEHGKDLWEHAQVGVHAKDPLTLVLDLRGPTPFLPALTRHHTWFPVPRHVVLEHGDIADRFTAWSKLPHLVGNGPFQLTAWELHDRIQVRRNPHYWDAGNVWLAGIDFLPIENPYTETRAFLAGQLHTTYSLPPDLIPSVRRNTPEALRQEPYVGTTLLRFNTTRPGLDDARVRMALSLAINREEICRHILEGYRPATSLTPDMGGYQSEAVLRYDPERARKLLADAGYPKGRDFPRYSLLISRPSARALAETMQGMWRKDLGILVDIQNMDWGSYISARQNLDYDMTSGSWIGDYLDPTTFLNIWTKNNGNNNTGWSNPEYEKLLTAAAHQTNPDERFATLRRAERLFIDAQPVVPTAWFSRNYLHDPRIRGWHPLLLDNHPWKHIRFENP